MTASSEAVTRAVRVIGSALIMVFFILFPPSFPWPSRYYWRSVNDPVPTGQAAKSDTGFVPHIAAALYRFE